jgi:two-component system LytT family response regulator
MVAIRTLIVDDEPLAREGIRLLLEGDPDIEIVAECGSGSQAVALIEEQGPDLLFLDVEMPELNGFEVLQETGADRVPFVIFITAHDEFAIRAFEVHALDYLLKPFEDARFYEALERVKTEVRHNHDTAFAKRVSAMLADRPEARVPTETDGPDPPHSSTTVHVGPRVPYLDRLVVKRGGRVFFIDVGDIDWIEAADYYVRVHVGPESYLLRMTMKSLEESLDPSRFVRVHRSSIVSLDFVRELQPYFRGEYVVVLDDGTRLRLSRGRRRRIEQALGQRL